MKVPSRGILSEYTVTSPPCMKVPSRGILSKYTMTRPPCIKEPSRQRPCVQNTASGKPRHSTGKYCSFPADTTCWPNVDPMLVHRLRRWPYIKSTLGQRIVPTGLLQALAFGIDSSCRVKPDTPDRRYDLDNRGTQEV